MDEELPDLTLERIRQTAQANANWVVRTPVAVFGGLTMERFGMSSDIRLKLESFQRTGTFKARAAVNAIRRMSPTQRERGVTAMSAGNHAVAVAYAARQFGVSARIVVQASANPARLAMARRYGADVLIAPNGAIGFEMVDALVREEDRIFIHPFEGATVAEATAAVGMEFVEQAPGLEVVLVAVGGGGLLGGVAAAVRKLNPTCIVIGVEPENADVMRRSFEAGSPQRLEAMNTIADSLAPPMTTPFAYGLCRRHVEKVVTVADDEICRAMAVLYHDAKLVVEPAAAAPLAALLGPLRSLSGARIGLVICGANLDAASYSRHLAKGETLLDQ